MSDQTQELLGQLITLVEAQSQKIDQLEQHLNQVQSQVDRGQKTQPYIHENPFCLMDDPAGRVGMVIGYDVEDGQEDGDTYRSFEELFRGPVDRVLELQKPYLRLLEDQSPVLDVGCGRGEMIELLADNGIDARGVDMDEGMARVGQERGLDITVTDANNYLREQEDDSLGAIISMQVIEHIPYDELMEFFRLAKQKLRPGGVFIAETVNPHRPESMKTFWTDLTHQHPIFPEVALAHIRSAGFATGFLFFPHGSGDANRDLLETDAYSVVGYKVR